MSGLEGPVIDFGLLIIGAMLLGGVALLFRQPLILAYIVAGILLGSQGLGLIHDEGYLISIAGDLGIAMLLFVVGLELSFKKMLEVRKVVTGGTLGHAIILFILGLFAGYFLHFSFIQCVYTGLVLAFASTLLVVKMLGEKHQLDSLAGRILVGSLVFEDILVIITISILGIVAGAAPTGFISWFINLPGVSLVPYIGNLALLVGAILLLLLAYLLNRFIARYLFRFLSDSAEMLFVTSLGFLFIIAFVASELGFSLAIGAFIAGVIVANTDYYLDVLGRIKTLATFFSLLFFATLGFQITLTDFKSLLLPIAVLTVLAVLVKPLVTYVTVRLFGYDKYTSMLSGLYLSQISEFSLILVAVGIRYGHVTHEFLTITIVVLLLTFAISMYYMNYSHSIITWLQRRFRSLRPDQDFMPDVALQHATVVLYGAEHIDESFFDQVRMARPHILVVDPDPDNLEYLRAKGVPVISGSLSNEEVLEKVHVHKLEVVASAITDYEQNLQIVQHVRRHNKKALILMACASTDEALSLYEQGASFIYVQTFMDDAVVQQVMLNADTSKLEQQRKAHIERLKRISSRRSSAVDIEDFMSHLAQQPLRPVRHAIKSTKPVFDEVDKLVRQIRKK